MSRLAILGCAHIHTPNFVRMLKARTDHVVTGVWDHDVARAERTATQLGARVCKESDDAIVECDAVVICSETVRHEELVGNATRHRKHLFVEKPLGMSDDDSARMQRNIERAGMLFQTGFFMRGQPIPRYLRAQLAAGAFGKVTRVRAANCHAGSLKGWFDTEWRWMADRKLAGVGAFGDLGAHVLDLLIWMFGRVEFATAEIGVATGRYGDCDEYGEALLRFGDGVIATIAAGWVDVANPVTLQISGTEAMASVVNGQLFLAGSRFGDGRTAYTELPAALPHAFDQFLDALCGRSAELVPVADAAHGSTVMARLYRGAQPA
jgi:predicted dehydrogenase